MESPHRLEGAKRLLLSLGCFVLLALVFSPSYQAFLLWARVPEAGFMVEVRRAGSVLEQVQHPGIVITDGLHGAIQWRLLFPAIAHLLALPAPVLFSLSPLGCVALLFCLVTVLRRRRVSWGLTSLSVLILGAGSWFFTSVGWLGYFDAWLALGLVGVCCARKPWLLWTACLLAPWVDERFVLAFPLALSCRYWLWTRAHFDEAGSAVRAADTLSAALQETKRPQARWVADYLVPSLLVVAFAVLRLFVLTSYSGAHATVGGYLPTQHNFQVGPWRLLFGIWEGLRCAWLLLGVGLFLGWRKQGGRVPVLLAGMALLLIAGGLYTAQDFSRSMTMLLPLAVTGLLVLHEQKASWLPGFIGGLVLLALLLPAHHVMNDRVDTIYPLQHEIYLLDTPPRELMPELYELEGIHKMELGDNAAAEAKFDIAVLLDKHPASALQHRGLLRANQGRWPEALKDFECLCELEPSDSNSWLLYAQACFATNQLQAARTHMRKALSQAPEGWSKRPDVVRFLSKLNQQ